MGLTNKGLNALKAGKWASEGGNRNEGTLRAKGSTNGARFYFRYRTSAGSYDDLPLGSYDEAGKRGLTLVQARARAKRLRDRYTAGERDLRAVIDGEQREAVRERKAADAAAEAEATRKRATLGVLMTAYVEQLRRNGKLRVREVETALRLHVEKAWPRLWDTPAEHVTTDDCLAVVARLVEAGTLRQAGKLRSYLRAAFAAAIRARQDPRALPALRALALSVNPARDLATIEGSSKPRERALSLAELRVYWRRITDLPDPAGALLRFHLLTGGQRIDQLARLTTDDFDPDAPSVRIRDSKGRRAAPRNHDVPLVAAAVDALRAMRGGTLGPCLFTMNAGASGVAYKTVSDHVRYVAEAMRDAGELEKGLFTPGDLRRTVETRLSAAGVSREVRAQVQSHGLGGVQALHYDRHDYLHEKRAALETLHDLLTGAPATVTPIRRAGAKSSQ